MTTFACRIPPRLLQALHRIDDDLVPIAETCRRLGREAERQGLTRPSYERVRVLVHALRDRRDGTASGMPPAQCLLIRHRDRDSRLLALLQRRRPRPAELEILVTTCYVPPRYRGGPAP